MNRAPRPEFFMLFFLQKQKRHSKNILMNNVIFTLLYIKLNGMLQRIFGHREFLDTLNHHIYIKWVMLHYFMKPVAQYICFQQALFQVCLTVASTHKAAG